MTHVQHVVLVLLTVAAFALLLLLLLLAPYLVVRLVPEALVALHMPTNTT
jgi:hypothetical protein